MAKHLQEVAKPLEAGTVAKPVHCFDDTLDIGVVERAVKDFEGMANSASQPWVREHVSDRSHRVRNKNSAVMTPFPHETPGEAILANMMNEEGSPGEFLLHASDPPGGRHDRRAKDLVGERPVIGSRPSRDIAGLPYQVGEVPRILSPSRWVRCIPRYCEI